MSSRIKLVVAYDGTDFCGWAPQAGQRTVQSTLREAVRQVSGEEVEIVGASRTDSGAHARGQVCHYDTKSAMPPARWAPVLNHRLPSDLVVVGASGANPKFHSRFCAMDRFYRYRILTGAPDPERARFAYWYGRPLDVAAMQEASATFLGHHDFRAYTEELDPGVENTHRTLFSFQVRQSRDEVWLDVIGTAFLRGMMRRMAGALLEVGRRHRSALEVSKLLQPEERNHIQWPVVLPANGLCLMRIRYGRHPRDNRS